MLLLSLLTFAEVVRSGIEMPDIPTRALGGNLFEVILPEVQTLVTCEPPCTCGGGLP